jgi:SNF2 family DNA or RNA helicase
LDGEPLLVAYSFQFDLDRILRRFPKARILSEDPDAYDDWNAGKIQMLLCHPKSAGHGLNLQYGGHNNCWYGLNWSLELYQQMNGRLPRTGQASAFVMNHHIITEGTRDETVYDKMQVSGATQDDITRAVQVELDMEYGRGRGRR